MLVDILLTNIEISLKTYIEDLHIRTVMISVCIFPAPVFAKSKKKKFYSISMQTKSKALHCKMLSFVYTMVL